jgi:pyruvate/oxaloacetate carboxyltransferase
VKAKIIGSEPTIDHRPADDLEPQFAALQKKYGGLAETEEDVLSIALFENVAVKFLEERKKSKTENEVVEFNLYIGR